MRLPVGDTEPLRARVLCAMSNIIKLAPTAKLRFVERESLLDAENAQTIRVLQQFFAPDVPEFMRGKEGEWRDVECVRE